ncbi:MAG: cytosine deaminase [Rhodobacteraceae bacterium]|nr:cytosine deaminase [Paracoccaceae bacterium]MCY4195971.1 cytosine deaminase [Paracoccaceae bacterium]MCY4326652.1 cytosine deaminase [Paracoccaceae bacterium]
MRDVPAIPETGSFVLVNATLFPPSGVEAALEKNELYVKDGKFSASHDGPKVDIGGAMVLPIFTDMHTHLDKGHIWPRAANPDGTFDSALTTVQNDRQANWNAADVRRRMEFALTCAYQHGTCAVRTHLDSAAPQHRISWPVFNEVREKWKDRIALQAVTIFGIELMDDLSQFDDIADIAADFGGILGSVTYPLADLDTRLDKFFAAAAARDMDTDFHVDETRDPNSATLRQIAESALRVGFQGRIVAGHCCSLARQNADEVSRTLDLVKQANISIVSLPMCNLYLQDRIARQTPRWRGVTLVHEMRTREIPVAFASDNTRDPFYAYGDLDMIEVMREATRICHLDHSEHSWHDSFTATPAQICSFGDCRWHPNEPANFIICRARNWSEFFSRPQSDRIVVRNGRVIDRRLPDYDELDDLMVTQ